MTISRCQEKKTARLFRKNFEKDKKRSGLCSQNFCGSLQRDSVMAPKKTDKTKIIESLKRRETGGSRGDLADYARRSPFLSIKG